MNDLGFKLLSLIEKNCSEDNEKFLNILRKEHKNNILVENYKTNLYKVSYSTESVKNNKLKYEKPSEDDPLDYDYVAQSDKNMVLILSDLTEDDAICSDAAEIEYDFDDFMRNKNTHSKNNLYSNVKILDIHYTKSVNVDFNY